MYKIVRRPPCWKSTARLARHARLDWLDKVELVESSRAKWNLSHSKYISLANFCRSSPRFLPFFHRPGKNSFCRGRNRTLIEIHNHITTLGVTLDSNLTLNMHVSSVCKTAYYFIEALRHIRLVVTCDMARAVAASLIQTPLT